MAQFRVEFVLEQASGKYLAELYSPENHEELIVRTEALYPTQAAAVLGLVQLFKDAILKFPKPGERPARVIKKRRPAKKAKKKAKRLARSPARRKGRRKHNRGGKR